MGANLSHLRTPICSCWVEFTTAKILEGAKRTLTIVVGPSTWRKPRLSSLPRSVILRSQNLSMNNKVDAPAWFWCFSAHCFFFFRKNYAFVSNQCRRSVQGQFTNILYQVARSPRWFWARLKLFTNWTRPHRHLHQPSRVRVSRSWSTYWYRFSIPWGISNVRMGNFSTPFSK